MYQAVRLETCIRHSGKRVTPTRIEANALMGGKQLRLQVRDRKSGAMFFIDTGSDVSVLSRSWNLKNKRNANINLYAADDTTIKTYEERTLELELNLRRNLTCKFVVAIPIDIRRRFSSLVQHSNRH